MVMSQYASDAVCPSTYERSGVPNTFFIIANDPGSPMRPPELPKHEGEAPEDPNQRDQCPSHTKFCIMIVSTFGLTHEAAVEERQSRAS